MSNWDVVVEKITSFIRQKVNESNAKGVVVGVSGGVDSACVTILSQKALGAENVKGLIMPEKGITPEQDIIDAVNLCKELGIDFRIIEINPFVDAFEKILGKRSLKAIANLKPRIRMTILYFHANSENMIVVGTGNKTELSVGYFTKYGDGGVDILPIGDLYKTEVFKLAEYIGVPENIIKKKPSAGLWKGQTDEKEMGISYEKLDLILKSIEKNIEEIDAGEDEIKKVKEMVKISSHKRESPPAPEIRTFIDKTNSFQ
ncbi:MAG TPA: NAD+ synthase [Archaeoglobaceae archaeon]|nr:NAD+ synthase [Archaeoglobaceae archaeon]